MTDNLALFKHACEQRKIIYRQFTPYQYRFTAGGFTFDYYPVSGKVNEVGTKIYFIPDDGIVSFIEGL